MHFPSNISMYRVSKLFLFYKYMYGINEDVLCNYQFILCELMVNSYFSKSIYYEIL